MDRETSAIVEIAALVHQAGGRIEVTKEAMVAAVAKLGQLRVGESDTANHVLYFEGEENAETEA